MAFLVRTASVSDQQLANFVRQLQTMLDCGVGIVRALEFFATTDTTELGEAIEECLAKVQAGYSLSKGLGMRPDLFSPVFIGFVEVGERSGGLVRMLDILASVLERQGKIQAKIKNALVYPTFLLTISLIVGVLFTYSILPTMEPMLASVHVGVPWPTQVLLVLGQWMRNPIVLIALAAVVLEFFLHGPLLLAKIRQDPKRREFVDRLPLRLPAIGPAYHQVLMARLMFVLSAAIEVGMTIPEALRLSEAVVNNEYAIVSLREVTSLIRDGDSLSGAVERVEFFPKWVSSFVSLGEDSASLPRCMQNVALLCEDYAETVIDICSQLVEPILLCGITVAGGFLTVACMAPIVVMLRSL